jgi:hypothetical protein
VLDPVEQSWIHRGLPIRMDSGPERPQRWCVTSPNTETGTPPYGCRHLFCYGSELCGAILCRRSECRHERFLRPSVYVRRRLGLPDRRRCRADARHRERSEAISATLAVISGDCFVATLLAMTCGRLARPQARPAPVRARICRQVRLDVPARGATRPTATPG